MDLLNAAGSALATILEPVRFLILLAGIAIGVVVGIIPGVGGLTAIAILIPFTYAMDPYSAFAFLIGLWAVTATSDVIPAVFFGVPGTVGCAATVLDGYPLAKQGQAARALGACYAASTLGGLFGAAMLALSVELLRPVMLFIGSPELLAFSVFGLSMVAAISGRQPLRGMAAAGLGLMIAMIGIDPQTGTERWTFGTLYLWDGVPLSAFALGLFAVPELAGLMIARTSVTGGDTTAGYSLRGQMEGLRDVLRHWWLTLRCAWLGAALGAVPGIGASIIDWIAYGHAVRTEKNAHTFGTGDIRGVIASEASNNAREGGALLPMIVFGVPGSAGSALLLSAFLIHGLTPGPEMLTKHLDVTFTIIWSLVLATLISAAICVVLSGVMVKLVALRYSTLLPIILSLAFVGGYEGGRHDWGDPIVILAAGLLGWLMRELGWPRAPLLLGLVLGDLFERYLFISIQRYGSGWLSRPLVILLFVISIYGMARSSRGLVKRTFQAFRAGARRLHFGAHVQFNLAFIAVVGVGLVLSLSWPGRARVVPEIVAIVALAFASVNLVIELFRPDAAAAALNDQWAAMDLPATSGPGGEPLPRAVVFRRGAVYFAWLVGVVLVAAAIGLLPALVIFAFAFAQYEGGEPRLKSLALAAGIGIGCFLLFDVALGSTWPRSLVGDAFPALRAATRGLV